MTEVESYMKVPQTTPGRRRMALGRMLDVVLANSDWAFLEEPIRDALEAQEETIHTLRAWRDAQESAAMHASEATALDAQCDQALSSWLGLLRNTQSGFGETVEATAAALMEETLFPNGVGPITRLPFVDQHGEMDLLLVRVREEPALAEAAATLHLEPLLTRLEGLVTAYGAALSRTATLSYNDLRELDRQAWRAVVGVVARILGAFPDPTEEHEQAVRTLLEPYTVQVAEFAKLKQRRSKGALFDFDDVEDGADEEAEAEDEAVEA